VLVNHLKFITEQDDLSRIIQGNHDPVYVILSVSIAVIASYAAFEHTKNCSLVEGFAKRSALLFVAAFTMGGGVWAMHFLAMMAFRIPAPMKFDAGLTILSIVPVILASALVLRIISQPKITVPGMMGAAVVIGSGIGIMHFMGMAAMQVTGVELYYDPLLFGVAIAAAVAFGFVAIVIKVKLPFWVKVDAKFIIAASSFAMGVATSAMHYTAMQAAYFIPTASYDPASISATNSSMPLVTIFGAIVVLGLSVMAGFIHRQIKLSGNLSLEVTQRKRSEEALSLINRIMFAANRSASIADAFQISLEELVKHNDWLAGRAYYSEHGTITECIAQTGPQNDLGGELNDQDAITYAWNGVVPSNGEFVRRIEHGGDISDAMNVITRFVFPVVVGFRTKLIMEFVADGEHEADADFIKVMETICLQLGESVELKEEKKRIEESESTLRETTTQLGTTLKELEFQQNALDQHAIVSFADVSGKITYANDRFCEITGYDKNELLGQNHRIVKSDEHTSEFYHNLWETISSGRIWRGEIKNQSKDGSFYWVYSTIVPFLNEKGKPFKYVSIRTDITTRKAAEEDLKNAITVAEQASASKSSFLAAMSHEIRTPMNGVIGMIDILNQTSLESEQKHMLGTVRDSAYSLLHIINDILDFSKIEAGKLTIEKIPVYLPTVVEGVIETLLPNADAKNVLVELRISPCLQAWVVGDQIRIRQILFNIIGNAIKFTEDSEGSQNVITVAVDQMPGRPGECDSLLFAVSDTGIGMSGKQVAELFKPFIQAESSTMRRFGGTGLGLSISKQLVDMMGGSIGVESEVGIGTTFNIELPFEFSDPDMSQPIETDISGVRALVAIADPATKEIAINYLQNWGVSVSIAGNPYSPIGNEAKSAARFEVVVTCLEWERDIRNALSNVTAEADNPNLHYVILTPDRVLPQYIAGSDSIPLSAFPLLGGALRRTVAVAAGRASQIFQFDDKIATSPDHSAAMTVEEAERRGQLILIAEDNEVNQDVLLRQLTILGYAAEVFSNGAEALDAWRSGRYGLLLTDCHMPVMDGFELTSAIREAELEKGDRTAIIAITANALSGESEKCLKIGMDDFLSKPVELKYLKKTLNHWLPLELDVTEGENSHNPVQQVDSSSASLNVQESPVDPMALSKILGDDPELHLKFLKKFIDPSQEIVTLIGTAYSERSATDIADLAHKLKSSARTVGANELADTCAALEAAGRDEDWSTLDNIAPKIGSQMENVEVYIQSQ